MINQQFKSVSIDTDRSTNRVLVIMIHTASISVLCSLFAVGCASVGPDYVIPEISVPQSWSTELFGEPAQSDSIALSEWWTTLNDPVLSELITQALETNLDIESAKSRLREARLRRGITRSGYFPTVQGSGSARGNRTSTDDGVEQTSESYAAGFDASWEIDIFGGTRRSVEASVAEVEASEADLRDVLVSVISEVALNYIDVRSYQTRLSITEENIKLQTETYDLTHWRSEAGLTTQLDVEQATYSVQQTRAEIPGLEANLIKSKNRLAVLLGKQPGVLDDLLDEQTALPVPSLEIAIGIPAEVLRRRPDVRSAERRLAAQTAQIGATAASRFPSLSLSGSTGLESLDLSELFSAGTWVSSIASNISWTLFDAGRIRKNIDVQTELQRQALISYETTILTALEDVENALVAYASEQVRHTSLAEASEAAQRAVVLVSNQYESGLVDFQTYLDTQRSALSLRDQLASSEATIVSNLIQLYKALGGGWTSMQSSPIK